MQRERYPRQNRGRANPWGPSFYPLPSSTASYWPSLARHRLAEDPGVPFLETQEAGEEPLKAEAVTPPLPPATQHPLERASLTGRLQHPEGRSS